MKKIKLILATSLIALTLSGCSQWQARKFGGEYTVHLPENKKLVEVTWKDNSLWYSTRDMRKDENAETYTFQEDSVGDVMEGTVTIIESQTEENKVEGSK